MQVSKIQTPAAFDEVATQEGVWLYRHRQNKLRVALCPLPTNGVCALSIVFMVGSKSEITSMTGSAHLLEHELFKSFKNKETNQSFNIWKTMQGAQINASTSKNRTEFHMTMSCELIYIALSLEALRMEKSPLTGLKTERIVVRNERERGKNNPSSYLRELVYKIALDESSTIGSNADIENIMNHAEQLRQFFRKFYCCANAAIVISGSFDTEKVLKHIDAAFGHLPEGESTREGSGTDIVEPVLPQRGVRSVDIAGEMPIGTLSFRASDGMTREGIVLELLAMWFSSGPAGPFAEKLRQDPELHGVEADFCRVHGPSLFTLWLLPVSGGNATARIDRLQADLLNMVTKDELCMRLQQDKLENLKKTLAKAWQAEVNSPANYTQAIVESFARSNSPFDVCQRHHVLDSITLRDVRDCWHKVFVTYRLTVGRVLPELMSVENRDPEFTGYSVDGGEFVSMKEFPKTDIPFAKAVLTESGVYLKDENSPDVCLRVHIPSANSVGDAEASLRASLAMTGVKMQSGEVLRESELHDEFVKRGASASVSGSHRGVDIHLNVKADEDVGRLVHILHAGIRNPMVTDSDYSQKQRNMSEVAVGSDYEVTDSARRLFSRCLYHEKGDPRQLQTGLKTSEQLRGVHRDRAMRGLSEMSRQAAWVTCVAPTNAHLRLVRELFDSNGAAKHDESLAVPSVSPYAGRVTTLPMQGKTSATMIYGCAANVGPDSKHALPLSLAMDSLGGGFSSRLMQNVREKEGLTYAINASTSLSDPSTTTAYVVGTFAPSLLERGVKLTKSLVREWRDNGITEEELADAKKRAVRSTSVAWSSSSNVADALHASRVHFAQPASRCETLAERINAVTLNDCNEALSVALPKMEDWVCVCAGAIPEKHTM